MYGTAPLAGTNILILFSQKHASAHYPEPNESSLHSNIYPTICTKVFQVVLIARFYNPNILLIFCLSRAQ
jgi:hypothetical protein